MVNSIWVWGESVSQNVPAAPPTLSVSAWPYLFDKEWLRWDTSNINNAPIPDIEKADVAFVNLFHTLDSVHVKQIKSINPSCFIVAMPDPTLDLVLQHPDWQNMYDQMRIADMVAGRTRTDSEVYGTLLNKRTTVLPSPVGPSEWFTQFRGLVKEDYLITLDHRFAPANTVCNVASVVAIQRLTKCKVLYVAERPQTRMYAELAGLECEFLGDVPFSEFCSLTARARLCVDMYASHSYGRQNILCAMVGTYCIGSDWCTDVGHHAIDPFEVKRTATAGAYWWNVDSSYRASFAAQSQSVVEWKLGFYTSKARLNRLLDEIEKER